MTMVGGNHYSPSIVKTLPCMWKFYIPSINMRRLLLSPHCLPYMLITVAIKNSWNANLKRGHKHRKIKQHVISIKINNVSKIFGKFQALNDINFTVPYDGI